MFKVFYDPICHNLNILNNFNYNEKSDIIEQKFKQSKKIKSKPTFNLVDSIR